MAVFEFNTEFGDNRQPRCACVLLLDTSFSMKGDRIARLNEGLRHFADTLHRDSLAEKRVEIALVTFPGTAATPFIPAMDFHGPTLQASGSTPLGEAMMVALDLIEQRKLDYKAHRIDYYRPWIFLISDGCPDPGWEAAAAAAREAVKTRKVVIWPVAVDDADEETLGRFADRPPMRLKGLEFSSMFEWLTASLGAVAGSNSHSGGDSTQKVPLSSVGSWAEV